MGTPAAGGFYVADLPLQVLRTRQSMLLLYSGEPDPSPPGLTHKARMASLTPINNRDTPGTMCPLYHCANISERLHKLR